MVVDVGFDVDGVRGRAAVDEGDENAEGAAEHGGAGLAELGGGFASGGKGFFALLGEGYDFGQKDDVFPIQFAAGGVDLEAVVLAVEAGVEGFHRVHFASFGGCFGGAFGSERVFGTAEGGAIVEIVETFLVKVGEGAVHFTGDLFVLEDGVDGEAEGD